MPNIITRRRSLILPRREILTPSIVTPDTPASEWLFNDGSGSTAVDSRGAMNLALTGTGYTWGSGYLNINLQTSGEKLEGADTTYYDLTDFTIYIFFLLNGAPSSTRDILNLGNFSGTGQADYSFRIFGTGALGARDVSFIVSTGAGTSIATADINMNSSILYLLAAKYNKTGTLQRIRVTAAASESWASAEDASAVAMQNDASFKLYGGHSDAQGSNIQYHRAMLYTGYKSDAHDSLVFAHGAEGAALT